MLFSTKVLGRFHFQMENTSKTCLIASFIFRSYKYDINELTPFRFMAILLVSILILTMMAVTLIVVVVLPLLMSGYFLCRQSFRLFNWLWVASSVIVDQVAVLNGTLALITPIATASDIDIEIDLFANG